MLNLLLGSWGPSTSQNGWIASAIQTRAGIPLSYDAALNYSAVWCATRVLAEANAVCPICIYQREDDGDRELYRDHRLNDCLRLQPNPAMGLTSFREGRMMHMTNWGNGFAEIAVGLAGDVELYPIHPSRVHLPDTDTAKLGYAYSVRNNDGSQVPMRREDVLHLPGVLSEDGIWGKGVIPYGRESIAGGLAVEKHTYDFWGTGGQPKGVLTTPGVNERETRANLRAEWKQVHGQNSGEIAIFPPNTTYVPITIPNEASQFIETRKHNVGEIARWYRVPVYFLEEYEKAASFASVEQRGIDFVVYSVLPWVRKWEDELNRKLISVNERDTIFIEIQLGGLLRGDLKSRYDAYLVALQNGWLTINEIRRLENLNGIGPAGDQHFIQLNMTTAERIFDGTAAPPAAEASAQAMLDEITRKAIGAEQGRLEQLKVEDRRQQVSQARAAARSVLADSLRRMFTKEAGAVERAFRSADFPQWLKDFHEKHRRTLADALAPAAEVLELAGIGQPAAKLADAICSESRDQLLVAYDTTPTDAFAAKLSDWAAKRSAAELDKILKG